MLAQGGREIARLTFFKKKLKIIWFCQMLFYTFTLLTIFLN